jgi:hypothetical protein
MEYKFPLHAGEIGEYEWGSLLVRFASLAKVSPRIVIEIIAGAIAGNATWTNGAEFRGYIAILHEVVHYFQDAYTSIGHWDYFVKRKYVPDVLAYARLIGWLTESFPPYPIDNGDIVDPSSDIFDDITTYKSSLQKMLFQLIYPASVGFSNHHSELVLKYMRSIQSPVPVQSGDEQPFTIRNLLEAEAAATVWLQIHDLKMADEQWEIAQDNASLFGPGKMPEIYAGTIRNVLQVMDYKFGAKTGKDESVWTGFKLRLSMLLTVLLVDLACAYPTPVQLESSDLQKDYEPGIRFIRLLSAFQSLAEKETINDFVLAIHNSEFEQAEGFLLQECEFPYLKAADIYKSWITYYGKLEDVDDQVLKFRKNCIAQRVNDFSSYIFKRPSLAINKTHLYWITPKGMEALGSSPEYLDSKSKNIYVADFLRQKKEWELVNFFFMSGEYHCPLAETNFCEAVTPTCRSGIRRLEQLPPKPGCLIRSGLEESQFNLF